MSKEPVYIKEITITNYKCFRGEHNFPFYNSDGEWCQWTIFLGNNNTGKTNLLKAIAAMVPRPHDFPDRKDISKQRRGYYATKMLRIAPQGDFKACLSLCNGSKTEQAKVVGRTAHGVNDPSLCSDFNVFGYGVIRELENPNNISNANAEGENAANLLNNVKLTHFESWLLQLDYSAKNAEKEDTKREAKRQLSLLIEILTGDIFPEISNVRFVTDEKLNNYVEYQADGVWLKFSSLGYGYQSALSWIADFCKKLFDKYPGSENPLKEPAVLLIDEIDLHLHPQWQRTIVKHLSAMFPRTQFIVTTHSPFVIQSMEKVNLFTLHHEDRETSVRHFENASFVGWGIEEILSEVMELNDKIKTDKYRELIDSFDAALDSNNYKSALDAYEELSRILNPQSAERKLLEIQLSQLTPEDD